MEFLNGNGCKSVTAEKKGHVLLEVIFTPHVSSSFFITKPEVEPFINWFIGKYFTNLLILPRFLPVCVRAKFWDRLILPQILDVLKSRTTKIDFVDFLQIQK